MHLFTTFLIAMFAISSPSLSFAEEDPMDHCPVLAVVKTVTPDFAQTLDGQHWMVGKPSAKYGTNFSWMFAISHIQAADKNEAFIKSKAAINTLVFKRADRKTFSCRYTGFFEGQEIKGHALPLA